MPEAALSQSPNLADHARALRDQLVSEGKIAPDPDAALQATGIPSFSKGTLPLDPNTGQPIVPPTAKPGFGESPAPAPPATETTGTAKPEAPRTRNEKGQFAGEKPEEPAVPSGVTPTAQAAGEKAVEKAAEQVANAFADWVEFEIDDPDLDAKIPVRVPKQYESATKRGFPRRADYDRTKTRWGEYAPVIEPLLQDGRFRQVYPLLQAALQDPRYGEYVWQGFQRLQAGLPLIEQAAIQAAQAPQAAPLGGGSEPLPTDPYVEAALAPYRAELERVSSQVKTFEQQRAETESRQRLEQQQQAAVANQLIAAHQDLERMYPGQYASASGPMDPAWQKATTFARDAGYIDAYGIRAGIVFGAQQVAAIEQERLAATASPAAMALEKTAELARSQAIAAAQSAGGGAQTATAAPAPRQKPVRTNPDGTLKSAEVFAREMQGYLAGA